VTQVSDVAELPEGASNAVHSHVEADLEAAEAEPQLPSVAVVVPTRDRPELLRKTVASILAQDYAGSIDVLVVQDHPDDGIAAPILPAADAEPAGQRTVHLLSNLDRRGAAATRNVGLRASAELVGSELVALCDDDDVWLPGKLTRQVAALAAAPDAIGCGTGYNVVREGVRTPRLPEITAITHQGLLRDRLADVHPSSLVFRRDLLLQRVGLMDEDIPGSYGEDYDWLLRATLVGPVLALSVPDVDVLWHDGSFFGGQWATIRDAIKYLLVKHPDLHTEPAGLARLYGRLAFASAALGERRAACQWALRTLRISPREKRAYVALAAGLGIVSPARATRMANARGRGL
jgi:glycosyltransferase involved in cell wall biosynthesis